MGHYGFSSGFPINAIYKIEQDPGNSYDTNAVKIGDRTTGKTVAFFTKAHATLPRPIFDNNWVSSEMYVKIKEDLNVKYKPTQSCVSSGPKSMLNKPQHKPQNMYMQYVTGYGSPWESVR